MITVPKAAFNYQIPHKFFTVHKQDQQDAFPSWLIHQLYREVILKQFQESLRLFLVYCVVFQQMSGKFKSLTRTRASDWVASCCLYNISFASSL